MLFYNQWIMLMVIPPIALVLAILCSILHGYSKKHNMSYKELFNSEVLSIRVTLTVIMICIFSITITCTIFIQLDERDKDVYWDKEMALTPYVKNIVGDMYLDMDVYDTIHYIHTEENISFSQLVHGECGYTDTVELQKNTVKVEMKNVLVDVTIQDNGVCYTIGDYKLCADNLDDDRREMLNIVVNKGYRVDCILLYDKNRIYDGEIVTFKIINMKVVE